MSKVTEIGTSSDRSVEDAAEKSVDEAATLSPKLVYEVVRRSGQEELHRPTKSLIWSGIAAGSLISFSVLGEAILRTNLPDTQSHHLIENFGYCFGFILVILGCMQLFTENTITTFLPVAGRPSAASFGSMVRLWGIVLTANVIGAFAAACLFAFTPALPPDVLPAIKELSEHATGMPAMIGFARAIPAGILVAAIVWLMPEAKEASFFIILIFTWLIGVGDFTHIVAGSVEMAYLLVTGELAMSDAVFRFFLPVLAGNVVGGTAIFSLMAWGQVKDEVE